MSIGVGVGVGGAGVGVDVGVGVGAAMVGVGWGVGEGRATGAAVAVGCGRTVLGGVAVGVGAATRGGVLVPHAWRKATRAEPVSPKAALRMRKSRRLSLTADSSPTGEVLGSWTCPGLFMAAGPVLAGYASCAV